MTIIDKITAKISTRRENARLKNLPRYVPTETDLLGTKIKIVDANTFLGGRREIFGKKIYEFKTNNVSPLIIDCGSNIGLSVIFFKKLYPNARILAFEPDPAIHAVLSYNIGQFGFMDVNLYNKAIWISESTVDFSPEGGFSGRIALPGDEQIVKVPSVRLCDLLSQPVDFLKIDIEGAETDVLLDCADRLTNVRFLFVEYHSHISKPQTLDRILSTLTKANFRYQIKEAYASPQPYIVHKNLLGMDLQLNISCYRY